MRKETKERILLLSAVILICVIGFIGIYIQDTSLIFILAPVPFIIALLMYLYTKQKTLCQNCGKRFGLKFIDTDTRSAYTISLQKKDSNGYMHTEVFQVGEERDYFICKHCGFVSFKTKKFKTQIK